MIISVALSGGALTCLTDRCLILSPPACVLHFFNTGWVTDPQTGHKPANGVVMQTTACNGTTIVVVFVVIDWQSAYKAALAQRTYTVFTEYDKRLHRQHKQDGCMKKQTLGCCRLLHLCHLSLPGSFPSRFLLDTIYVRGQIKNQPKKTKNTIKVSKLIQNFPRQLGNTRGFIQRRNNSCNAVRRSSEWRNRVRGRVWMANQTVLVFQMAFPSRK